MASSDHTLSWPGSGGGGLATSLALAVLALPAQLWRLYVDYLWDPAPGSWVSRSAYTFRILAYFVLAPFVLLTLLDVTSYVIARTLGVVETTGASTTDKVAITIDELASAAVGAGAVRGSDVGPDRRDSDNDAPFKTTPTQRQQQLHHQAPSSPPAYFFSPTEENNLALSGANILSPAASRQGSPGVERRVRELPPVSEGAAADAGGSASAATSPDALAGVRRRAGVGEAPPAQALQT